MESLQARSPFNQKLEKGTTIKIFIDKDRKSNMIAVDKMFRTDPS